MQAWIDALLPVVVALVLLAVNGAAVMLVMCQLPGTWLIVFAATAYAWYSDGSIGVWTLAALAGMAVLGELVELLSAAAGAAKAGGTRRGAVLALAGAMLGAVVGSLVMVVIGTIAGACLGAAAGSYAGDRWAGRDLHQAFKAGREAAKGRLWGTLAKIAIAAAMWLLVAVALIF